MTHQTLFQKSMAKVHAESMPKSKGVKLKKGIVRTNKFLFRFYDYLYYVIVIVVTALILTSN